MFKRIQRINALIQEEISKIILREIEFPQNVLVTVTRVETSDDIRDSNIFVSVMPQTDCQLVLGILNKNIYFLQHNLNKRLRIKPLPRIRFLREKMTVEAGRIEEILEKLKKEEK